MLPFPVGGGMVEAFVGAAVDELLGDVLLLATVRMTSVNPTNRENAKRDILSDTEPVYFTTMTTFPFDLNDDLL